MPVITAEAWRLIPGDIIDILELPPHIVLDQAARDAAEFEMACVEQLANEGGRIAVYTSQGGWSVFRDHRFTLHGQVLPIAERGPRPGGPLLTGELTAPSS